ncbi:MAG: hypothetical protein JOY70_03800 [Acidisphaera sp.]|nr:hypothetical protein [Acidisphaera sp.]MBV9812254.1 hypothetical protein [Acetobacteraceae bacterium]
MSDLFDTDILASLLTQIIGRRMDLALWPASRDAPHCNDELAVLEADVAEAFQPSMRQHIDLQRLYQRATRRLPDAIDETPAGPLPRERPFVLDDLLGEP